MKPSLPTVLDSTMIVDFRSCYERFRNRYMLNLMGRDKSVDLIAGGAIAAAIEAYRLGVYLHGATVEQSLIQSYKAFTKEWGPYIPPEESAKQFTNCWLAVEDYFKTFPTKTDELQPLRTSEGRPFVEFSFAIPVGVDHPETGEPFIYVGRFDMLGEWMNRIVVSDEKTMGQMAANWVYQWSLRNQFMGYCWGAQQYGYQCNDALIRGICLLKYETKFVQAPAHYPDWMLSRWYSQLLNDLKRMVGYWKDDTRDYNFGGACTEYGGCSYRDLCVSAKPEVWYSHFNRAKWNPINRSLDPIPEEPQERIPVHDQIAALYI
jgi:hypothetical protein